MRVMAPNDVRLIWRDGFLLTALVVIMPLAGWLLNWLVPYIGQLVAEWVLLEPYYGLIVANVLVAGEPVLLGFVIGILFIEERDQGTLMALQTSPLSLRAFMGYRLMVAMALNVVLTVCGVLLADLASISWLALLASAALASLAVPMVALVYALYLKNKVQALMWLKPVQVWGAVSTLLFFVPTPFEWIGSVVGTLYYPQRLFWSASLDQTEWWVMVPGLLIPLAMLWWLVRRFERAVFA
jgi:fluoroquinolone transport system permease protein